MTRFSLFGAMGLFLSVWLTAAQADVPVFGNTTNNVSTPPFFIAAPGHINGWAVGFTPSEDIELSSVTLWLSGYDAAFINQKSGPNEISVQLWQTNDTGLNQPGFSLASFTTPGTNDGSAAPFTFALSSSPITLEAGQEYWIMADGFTDSDGVFLPLWDHGGELTGGVFDGLDLFSGIGFTSFSNDGTDIPDFTINTVPEPSEYALMSLGAILLGFWYCRKSLSKRHRPSVIVNVDI
jgi:hypothetical protein